MIMNITIEGLLYFGAISLSLIGLWSTFVDNGKITVIELFSYCTSSYHPTNVR